MYHISDISAISLLTRLPPASAYYTACPRPASWVGSSQCLFPPQGISYLVGFHHKHLIILESFVNLIATFSFVSAYLPSWLFEWIIHCDRDLASHAQGPVQLLTQLPTLTMGEAGKSYHSHENGKLPKSGAQTWRATWRLGPWLHVFQRYFELAAGVSQMLPWSWLLFVLYLLLACDRVCRTLCGETLLYPQKLFRQLMTHQDYFEVLQQTAAAVIFALRPSSPPRTVCL